MNTESTIASPLGQAKIQPFFWSVRRELWENRSIYFAPLIVAAVILFGMLVSASRLPERRRLAMLLDPAHRRAAIEMPYGIAAVMLMVTALIVGVFYCLDALHGERRDRSVLFWKSLPVSDRTTVLSKASIPLLVLPPIIFAIVVATQFIMLLVSSAALFSSGLAGTTWENFNFAQQTVILLYSVIVIAIWHAPIYGWALLVSGVARRATFLWAVLPPLAIGFFEKITFNTSYFASLIKHRLFGFAGDAFDFQGRTMPTLDSLAQLTPGRFLSAPSVWLGLFLAAAFLVGAVRLRRYRGPL